MRKMIRIVHGSVQSCGMMMVLTIRMMDAGTCGHSWNF